MLTLKKTVLQLGVFQDKKPGKLLVIAEKNFPSGFAEYSKYEKYKHEATNKNVIKCSKTTQFKLLSEISCLFFGFTLLG